MTPRRQADQRRNDQIYYAKSVARSQLSTQEGYYDQKRVTGQGQPHERRARAGITRSRMRGTRRISNNAVWAAQYIDNNQATPWLARVRIQHHVFSNAPALVVVEVNSECDEFNSNW
nr:hypothetical protein CFP56_04629 [Quercus suber]